MIYISPEAAMLPQMYSHDFLVRVNAPMLDRIVFDHLYTVQDAAVLEDCDPPIFPGQRAGTTEWQGQVGRIVVSLAWDWTEAVNGTLRPVRAVAPRTNIQLVDAQGYDIIGESLLWQRIDAMEWRLPVRGALSDPASQPH
jgi:hypothetical protein